MYHALVSGVFEVLVLFKGCSVEPSCWWGGLDVNCSKMGVWSSRGLYHAAAGRGGRCSPDPEALCLTDSLAWGDMQS